MRIVIRSELNETGTQLSMFEEFRGYPYQPVATDAADGQLQKLEARHRDHAAVAGFVHCAKATGLVNWLSARWSISTVWVVAVAIACDLLRWTRLLLLDGVLAVAEPHTLRYLSLHISAPIIKRFRKTVLRIFETSLWATELGTAFHRVRSSPGAQPPSAENPRNHQPRTLEPGVSADDRGDI